MRMRQSERDISMRCIKYFLFSVSAIFLVTSVLVISIGRTIYQAFDNVSFVLYDSYFTPASLVMFIGFLMMLVSIFGCFGALKESTLLVNLFGVALSVMFLMEVTATILAYNLRSRPNLEVMLEKKFTEIMPLYYEDEQIHNFFDAVQSAAHCCGVKSVYDWRSVEAPTEQAWNNIVLKNESMTVPRSCCFYKEDISSQARQCNIPKNGCLEAVFKWVYQSAYLLTTGAITIAVIQVLGIFFAFSLARSIRREKTERARLLWEIQESVIKGYRESEKKMEGIEVEFVAYEQQNKQC